jgi:hypothetical protein
MFNQYGSVLCIWCGSSMRLATIEPSAEGTSTFTFECRYLPCARSRVMVIGKPQLGQDVLSLAAWPVLSAIKNPGRSRLDAGWGLLYRDGDTTRH